MDNPYECTESTPDLPFYPASSSGERPTPVTVFGVLNIIFGAFGLICTPFGLLALYMPQPARGRPANPVLDLMKNSDYRTFLFVVTGIATVGSGALLKRGDRIVEWAALGTQARDRLGDLCYHSAFIPDLDLIMSICFNL